PAVVSGVTLSTTATATASPGRYPITATGGQAANYTVTDQGGTLTLLPSVQLLGYTDFATGADAGGAPLATLYNPDGSARFTRTAFDPSFAGGVRVAAADFTGDGTPDLVVGTGPGGPTEVRVLDGPTGQVVLRVHPFEPAFPGGAYVTTGLVTPDGH